MAMTDQKTVRDGQQQVVVHALLRQILHGTCRPGEQLPTVRELMKSQQVANLTVQKAFSLLKEKALIETGVGRGSFVCDYPPLRDRVALGFPNHPEGAKPWSLFYDATRSGAATVEAALPWRLPVYLGLAESASGLNDLDKLMSAIDELELGGFIFGEHPYTLAHTPLTSPDFCLPRVAFMAAASQNFPHIPAVYPDTAAFFRRAFEQLKREGRKRVGAVISSGYSRAKVAMVMKYAAQLGLETESWLIQGIPENERSWATNAVQGMLARRPDTRPDALIVIDDYMVSHALEGCRASGAVVGDDLAVIAYCNFQDTAPSSHDVEFLGFDGAELIAAALRVIRCQQDGKTPSPLTLVPPRFQTELKSQREQYLNYPLQPQELLHV